MRGLEAAINKKESSSQYLADLKEIREAYVQDVKENYSDISVSQSQKKSSGFDKKQEIFQDQEASVELYQERTETPEPSEVLRELFETNAAFAGYRSYTASLKKYQELMKRVDGYEKQIADIDDNIARLRSERRQSGKGTRIGDLSDKRIAIEKKIEQTKNKMFAMEAKELNSVVRAETKRLVQDERTKARLMYNENKNLSRGCKEYGLTKATVSPKNIDLMVMMAGR